VLSGLCLCNLGVTKHVVKETGYRFIYLSEHENLVRKAEFCTIYGTYSIKFATTPYVRSLVHRTTNEL
jgi:hypothetical protein